MRIYKQIVHFGSNWGVPVIKGGLAFIFTLRENARMYMYIQS